MYVLLQKANLPAEVGGNTSKIQIGLQTADKRLFCEIARFFFA